MSERDENLGLQPTANEKHEDNLGAILGPKEEEALEWIVDPR